jgi:peptide/nickel transport system ATP-binding protein
VAVLEVRNLYLHYRTRKGAVRAVDNLSFEVERGQTLAIVGESGCGKTSTASAILRLLPKNVARYEGQINLEGQDIMTLSDEEFRRKVRWQAISMVFQGAMNALNPTMRVGKQIAEPLLLHTEAEKEEALDEAEKALQSVGLPDYIARRYPHELSGGMKQRVVIAMALILKPHLVILDEPTSALDVMTQANIMNLLKRLKKEEALSYIFITHDLGLASDLADEVCIMYAGEAVEIGPAESTYKQPRHPYTEALLRSVPFLRSTTEPVSIRGIPADLIDPPFGCRFHPRCSVAFEECGWRAAEIARFFRGEVSGIGLPVLPEDRVQVKDDLTLRLKLDDGVDPRQVQAQVEELSKSSRPADRAFRAVQDIGIEKSILTIRLHGAASLTMIGDKHRASCLLLREGGGRDA